MYVVCELQVVTWSVGEAVLARPLAAIGKLSLVGDQTSEHGAVQTAR